MDTLLRDLRFGVRNLAKTPGFTLAAVLAIALGVSATSSMLTVIQAVLRKALPYDQPEGLVMMTGTFREGADVEEWAVSQMDFDDWKKRTRALASMSVFTNEPMAFNLLTDGPPERLSAELVSETYFSILGIEPALGRTFTAEENRVPMGHPLVVLSYDLWQNRFGGDPKIIEKTLNLNSRPYQVLGVAAKGFRGLSDQAELWVPSSMPPGMDFLTIRRFRWLAVVARMKPGVNVAQTQADMDSITQAMEKEFPNANKGMGVRVMGLKDAWFSKLRRGLMILLAGAAIILLIACVNVANLMLTRAVAKERDVAIATAMGASRGRLARQLLTESSLLALAGAVLGLLVTGSLTRALVALSGVRFQSFVQFGLEPTVILTVLALAALCGLAFGLVPVWVSLSSEPTASLRRADKNPLARFGRQRFQSTVVVAEVALALLLLIGAGLMLKGFRRVMATDLGFDPKNLLTLRIDLKGERYLDDAPVLELVQGFLNEIGNQPGVQSFAIGGPSIPTDGWTGGYISIEDHVPAAEDGTVTAMMHSVSPGYFETLRIPRVDGRLFNRDDRDTFAVIVSQAMAEKYWPGKSPVGKRLKFGARASAHPWLTVVGVVGNVQHEGLLAPSRPASDIYVCDVQFTLRLPLIMNFLVRSEPGVDAASLSGSIRQAINRVAPDLAVYDIATLEERLARQTDKGRFQVLLIGLFTALALALATLGVYSVVSYGVTQRAREISVRMAMGAQPRDVVQLVLVRGAKLAALGVILGVALALLLGRALSSLLYGVSATDPLILGGTTLLLFLLTLLATWVPARRAVRNEPVDGLRG